MYRGEFICRCNRCGVFQGDPTLPRGLVLCGKQYFAQAWLHFIASIVVVHSICAFPLTKGDTKMIVGVAWIVCPAVNVATATGKENVVLPGAFITTADRPVVSVATATEKEDVVFSTAFVATATGGMHISLSKIHPSTT